MSAVALLASRELSPAGVRDETRAPWTYEVEPLFLVGCGRSGTTWLQSMLGGHPAIYTGPETHFFEMYRPLEQEFRRTREKHFGFGQYMDETGFRRFIAESFWRFLSGLPAAPQGTVYFLEKSPDHCLDARFILEVFPRARFIHLVRDPRAVVASLQRASGSWASAWAPSTPELATQMWMERVRAGRAIAGLVPPAQYREVRYEDLRSRPEADLRALLEWLELPAGTIAGELVRQNSLEEMQREVRQQREPFRGVSRPNSRIRVQEGFIGPAPASGHDARLTPCARAGRSADGRPGGGPPVRARAPRRTRAVRLRQLWCRAGRLGPADRPGRRRRTGNEHAGCPGASVESGLGASAGQPLGRWRRCRRPPARRRRSHHLESGACASRNCNVAGSDGGARR